MPAPRRPSVVAWRKALLKAFKAPDWPVHEQLIEDHMIALKARCPSTGDTYALVVDRTS